jgi:hypothetical protein
MQKLAIGISSLLIFLLCGPSQAQQSAQQSTAEGASCDTLGQIVSDDVKRAASSLSVCHNLEHMLARRGITSSRSFENFVAEVRSEERANANAQPNQDEGTKQQDLQDRQQISAALNRAAVDTNLLLLRGHTALLALQASTVEEEERAYHRTKILNIFLGTTVGIIGSGMQFSNSTSVQHAGDGVSVAGGAITAVFAACTAEFEPPSETALAKSFQNDNQQHLFPETVWGFIKSDPSFADLVMPAAKSQAHSGKLLDCRWRKRKTDKSLATQVQFFQALENSIAKLSQANAELAQLAALQ